MQIDNNIVIKAWERSRGRCECTRTSHGHAGRCNELLLKENRGIEGQGCWEAHHVGVWGSAGLLNCQIYCCKCHKQGF